MSQRTRILIAVAILVILSAAVLGVEARRRVQIGAAPAAIPPGSLPIYLNGKLAGSVSPDDLTPLPKVSFVDAAEGKEQDGWLLRDVILLRVSRRDLKPAAVITVSSSVRSKEAAVTWAEADEAANKVMLDLSNRGTLKLVALQGKLANRDAWVQDADRVEVESR